MHIPPRTAGVTAVKAHTSYAARRILLPLQRFVHTETTGGIVLLVAAVAAIAWANSPFAASYERFWNLEVALRVGHTAISHTVREWINDGLMTLFFFVVGLEIKRELVRGELSGWQRASLPVFCAIGGMLVPALFYYAFNRGTPEISGWGIPMATDIAFALGVLALLGDRIPSSARIFLLALATVDDIGAILVIAVFYSEHVSYLALTFGLAVLGILLLMRVLGVQTVGYYVPWALMFWFAILESGIHPTIAGVVLGLLTPTGPYLARGDFAGLARSLVHKVSETPPEGDSEQAEAMLGQLEQLTVATESPADRIVRVLHPWSSYLVLPIFALANAGVRLTSGVASHSSWSPVARGIFLGLVAGKLAGICLFAFLAIRLRIATRLPVGGWTQMCGIGLLGGIGFTVSLFITDLAFANPMVIGEAKLGVLLASLLAGILGYAVLHIPVGPQRSSVWRTKTLCQG